jgi:hypothetical protein
MGWGSGIRKKPMDPEIKKGIGFRILKQGIQRSPSLEDLWMTGATKAVVNKLSKIWVGDPESGKNPGSRGQQHGYTALTLEDLCMTGATTAVGFGAAFRWVRRSSVRPPSPIDVKKLIANLNNKR